MALYMTTALDGFSFDSSEKKGTSCYLLQLQTQSITSTLSHAAFNRSKEENASSLPLCALFVFLMFPLPWWTGCRASESTDMYTGIIYFMHSRERFGKLEHMCRLNNADMLTCYRRRSPGWAPAVNDCFVSLSVPVSHVNVWPCTTPGPGHWRIRMDCSHHYYYNHSCTFPIFSNKCRFSASRSQIKLVLTKVRYREM